MKVKMKATYYVNQRSREILTTLMLLVSAHAFAQFQIRGQVLEEENLQPLTGAHVRIENSFLTSVTDSNGTFLFRNVTQGHIQIRTTFVGFQSQVTSFKLTNDTVVTISMKESAILGEEVNIVATRAQNNYPTAYTDLSNREIREVNLGKDMPYLIQTTPSAVVTSDAGTGIGYTGISIRGTDLTRINVTINGIPLNDAESQGVWFVDLPDLASSTENIQIQRGVGTSTNGAGAFGATINILTELSNPDPYGELSASYGSFDTWKTTLKFGTGMMGSKFAIDGRLSYLSSNGYIDRAFSRLKSYYLSGCYFGKHTTLKLITFSGLEDTYQAWEGVPGDSLGTNRTYNPAGEYLDEAGEVQYYPDQIDHYQQDHYQMIFSQTLMKDWNFNAAIHFTRGKGYYENYKSEESFAEYGLPDVIIGGDTITSTNLVNRKYLDNSFYGFTLSSSYTIPDKLKVTIGGAMNQYSGDHYGRVIWARYASTGNNERNWYSNNGLKNDYNVYTKVTYQPIHLLTLFADLQFRYVYYRMYGLLDDQRTLDQQHIFTFFNPKAGIFATILKNVHTYFSVGIGNREPSRNNYKDADPDRIPTSERLTDYELGAEFRGDMVQAGVNLYYMNYHNQLVLTGEINHVGEAIMVNVPKSYRAGIELSGGITLWKKLHWSLAATFSQNKINDFTEFVDQYDSTWNFTGQIQTQLGKTNLSFSPQFIGSSILTYKPVNGLTLSLHSKYVGKQYIDNTSNEARSLRAYFVNNLLLGYTFHLRPFSEIGITLMVNNLFSSRYETNGWVYRYYYDHREMNVNGFFPQALLNYQIGITLKI